MAETLVHTLTVVGQYRLGSGLAAGSSATYSTPGGKSVTIQHLRPVGGTELNFAISPAAVDAADFPSRIVAEKQTGGVVEREFGIQAGSLRDISGGGNPAGTIRQDYDPTTGSVGDVFVSGQTIIVQLYYETDDPAPPPSGETSETFDTAGAGTWTVPAGVTSVAVAFTNDSGYAAGYWAELVRSSSIAGIVESATGNRIWLRTSDGNPLEQNYRRRSIDAWVSPFTYQQQARFGVGGDTTEPDYIQNIPLGGSDVAHTRWRARKSGEDWLPDDNGIALGSIAWGGGTAYRFFDNTFRFGSLTANGDLAVVPGDTINYRVGDGSIQITYTSASPPSFDDPTGDALAGQIGLPITTITVPAANGIPAPTYAVQGSLPAGLQFNASTREITGTPTAVASGTITIRATNASGMADWTVDYAIVTPRQTLQLPASAFRTQGTVKEWGAHVSMRLAVQVNLLSTATGEINFFAIDENGSVTIGFHGSNTADFSNAVENNGVFTLASGSDMVNFGIFGASMTEPYLWTPDNAEEIAAFYQAIGTSGVAASLTLRDRAAPFPHFPDPTGDAAAWTRGVPITPIVVPAAVGMPAPTYAAVGSLPPGITFTAATRTIAGTPTALGRGTITIRATNSGGTDDWTLPYAVSPQVHIIRPAFVGTISGVLGVSLNHHEIPERIDIRPSFSGSISGVLNAVPTHIEVPETHIIRPAFEGSIVGALNAVPSFIEFGIRRIIRPSFSGTISGVLDAVPQHLEVAEVIEIRPSFEGAISGVLSAVPRHVEVPEGHIIRPAFEGAISGALNAVPRHIEVPERHIIRPAFAGSITGALNISVVRADLGIIVAEAPWEFSPLVWSFAPALVPTFAAALDPGQPGVTEPAAVIENTGAWAPPIQWSQPYRETYRFSTSIIVSEGGQEQRIAQRSHPRIDYQFTGYLDPENFRRIALLMAHRTTDIISVPHPRQSAAIAEDVEAGASQIVLDEIPPWMNPGVPFFLVNHLTNELVVAESITGTTVSLVVPVAGAYEAGHRVLRAAPGRPIAGPTMQALTSRAGTIPMRIAGDPVENWHYGYPEAFPETLNEREYFDLAPNWSAPVEVAIIPTWVDVDTGRGAVSRIDDFTFPIQRRRFRYLMHTEDRIQRILGLFYRARGRQKGFYLPSFTHDLSPVRPASSGATQFETAGVGAAEVFNDSSVFRRLRFLDRDGFYIREVGEVSALPNGNSAVTLTEGFPRDMMPDELIMASWVNLVRFETDDLTVDWRTGSVAETSIAVRTLEDPR